jgi:hypothetical protein
MVKLPATTCPLCQADLRTGERPEEKVPVYRRRGFKSMLVLVLVVLPTAIWFFTSETDEDSLTSRMMERLMLGLSTCADPAPKMWEEEDPEKDKQEVKEGYANWKGSKKSRARGQGNYDDETLDEEQRATRTDRRNYFASTLMSEAPSQTLSPSNNWYQIFPGEWDIAWITNLGTPEENILTGEWNFSWVNGGEALEDVLNVPYLWDMQDSRANIRITTLRTFNAAEGYWEGARILPGKITQFRAGRNQDGSIFETFINAQGFVEYWVYANLQKESFQVYISETRDNGQTYNPIAEIWSKVRTIEQM